jgi:predicted metalloprotease with PDZ domain
VTGIFGSGPATSDQLAVMSWNTLLLYPAGASIHELIYRASLELPKGWEYGTALRERKRRGERVEFEPVTLAELVDSPVASAAHHRVIDLTGDAAASHRLRLFADSSAALAIRPETEGAFRKLVGETLQLFGGSRPYRSYDFLLSLRDHIDRSGSSTTNRDNRLPERALIDDAPLTRTGLLPHEFVHTWNASTATGGL